MYRAWELFFVFFKIGAFTLGSGYAMMPQIRKELVTRRHWLDEDEFIDVESYTEDEITDMIYSGKIQDSKTIAAIMAYINKTKHTMQ